MNSKELRRIADYIVILVKNIFIRFLSLLKNTDFWYNVTKNRVCVVQFYKLWFFYSSLKNCLLFFLSKLWTYFYRKISNSTSICRFQLECRMQPWIQLFNFISKLKVGNKLSSLCPIFWIFFKSRFDTFLYFFGKRESLLFHVSHNESIWYFSLILFLWPPRSFGGQRVLYRAVSKSVSK